MLYHIKDQTYFSACTGMVSTENLRTYEEPTLA